MKEKDNLDTILQKLYKHIRDEVIISEGECRDEATIWRYVRKELCDKEVEKLEGHLLNCSECWETRKSPIMRLV